MEQSDKLYSKIPRERLLLGVIVTIGLSLRLWHISWGLPELYEEATPLIRAWKMWNWDGAGFDLNPHFFNYPALTFHLLFIVQGVQYCIGHFFGVFSSPQSFAASLSTVVIPARIVIALFDVGTILVAYRFAQEFANRNVALLAAAFIACNPLLIRQAHYITVDTPLTFFVMLALLFIYRAYSRPEARWYIFSGISIGLAASTKYTGAFLLIVLVAAHALRSTSFSSAVRSLKQSSLVQGIGAAVFVFLMTNPYILLSPGEFSKDFAFEQTHMAEGHLGIDSSQTTLGYYLLNVLSVGLGWVMFLLFLSTVMYWILKKERQHLFLLLFPAIYLAIISSWEMRAERYLLPVFPLMLIICSIGLIRAIEVAHERMQRSSTIIAGILIIIVSSEPLLADYNFERTIALPDTRIVTKNWIEQHVPAGSAIATGPFGIQLPEQSYQILNIPFLSFETERVAAFYDTRWYEDLDMLIASDYDYARYASDPQKYAEFLPFYDSLKTRWKLEAQFSASESQQGPTFWLYTPIDSLKHPLFDPSLFSKLEGAEESTRVSVFLHDLSSILVNKHRWEKSEQLLENIVSVEESNYEAHNLLAHSLFELGKYKLALVHLKKSIDTAPHQPSVVDFAGENLLRLGLEDEAEGAFQRALQMDNSYEPAYLHLITFYTNRDNKPKLYDTLRRYLAILPPGSRQAEDIKNRIAQLKTAS